MKRRLLIFLIVTSILALLMLTCNRCQPEKSVQSPEPKVAEITPPSQSPDSLQPQIQSTLKPAAKIDARRTAARIISPVQETPPAAEVIVPIQIDTIARTPPSAPVDTPSPTPSTTLAYSPGDTPWYPLQTSGDFRAGHPIIEGLLSSFSLPLGDLLVKENDSEWRNLMSGFSVTLAATLPLKGPAKATLGSKSEGVRSGDLTLSAAIRYNPLSHWFIGATFYRYLNSDYKAPWSPEFSYSFGYDDWHPYTLSLVYSNYGGNRLNPIRSKGESLTQFEEGTWSVGWKFVEPYGMEEALVLFKGGRLTHSVNYNLTSRYFDLKTLDYYRWKQTLSLATNYSIYGNWFAGITMFYYLDPGSRQPWNPDFTYSFGYFDWRSEKISVRYANYSGNRFPWNHRSTGTGRFKDGSITVSYGWSF